jgi:hypothetical protein
MTLAELVSKLDALADELAIYAAPRWRPASPAAALVEPDDGTIPAEAAGKTFFLSVRRAKQIIAARRAAHPELADGPDELARALVYCAIYDEAEPVPSLKGRDQLIAM